MKPSRRMKSNPDTNVSSTGNLQRVGGRKVKNVVSAADHAAMHEHYSFLPPETNATSNNYSNHRPNSNINNINPSSGGSSWQERMVAKYHEQLFKEFVLADLSVPGRIGLRWRTRQEVLNGRGDRTCGNKRCRNRSCVMDDLVTLEVPFSYDEHGERKKELVKLRLCSNCRPLLANCTANRSSKKGVTSPKCELERNNESGETTLDDEKVKKRKLKESKRKRRKDKKQRR